MVLGPVLPHIRSVIITVRVRLKQCWPKRWSPGLVNFVIALAYHFCLALPAAFMQPGDHLLADPCTLVTWLLS